MLSDAGLDLESLADGDEMQMKCVVVAPNLRDCAEEVSKAARDHVVMVRVDEETTGNLDDWVETGALKSRSEAAAVFTKIGLDVYDESLRSVADALREVEAAKQKVAERTNEVFGEKNKPDDKE